MMKIKQFVFNPVCVNTYVINDDNGHAAIIDCGCSDQGEWNVLYEYLSSNNLKVEHLLNTHLHLDHVFGNRYAINELKILPEASPLDYPLYENLKDQVTMFFGERIANMLDYSFTNRIGSALYDGNTLKIGEIDLNVIATPGHTPGGLCFYCEAEQVLFSGDTLFQGSIGRTDLDGGDYKALIRSLNKLMRLPDNTTVYPGHGGKTTVAYEREYNPYVQ